MTSCPPAPATRRHLLLSHAIVWAVLMLAVAAVASRHGDFASYWPFLGAGLFTVSQQFLVTALRRR